MKIKNIDKFPINLYPKKVGYRKEDKSLSVWASGVPSVIIRVNTDEGISGLGEATTITWYFNETQEGMIKLIESYEQLLMGENPFNVVNAHCKMDLVTGEDTPGCHSARAAIDMALYDISGKAKNQPVYEVLGGAYRTQFEMLTNLYEETPEKKAKAAREFVKKGFRGLKIKVGDTLLTRGWNKQNLRKEKDKLIAVLTEITKKLHFFQSLNNSSIFQYST